jgi:hypothetical protein
MDQYFVPFISTFTVSPAGVEPIRNDQFSTDMPAIDVWQKRSFFNDVISRDELILRDGGWGLFVVQPSPYLYYFHKFGVFPIITDNSIKNADDYISAVHEEPLKGSADSIAARGEIIVCASLFGSSIYCFNELSGRVANFRSKTDRPFHNYDEEGKG